MMELHFRQITTFAFSQLARHAHRLRGVVALCALTVAIYAAVKHGLIVPAEQDPRDRLVGCILCVLLAVLGFSVRVADLPKAFRIVFRGVVIPFTLYVATATPTVVVSELPWQEKFELELVRAIVVSFGIIAFWRLAFAFLVLVYMPWHKAVSDGSIARHSTTNIWSQSRVMAPSTACHRIISYRVP